MKTLRHNQLEPDRAFVLVIDLQERLLPLVRHHNRVVAAAGKLLEVARIFKLPILATEQYPEGIGPTDPAIVQSLQAGGARVLAKKTFSAWAEDGVRECILSIDRPQTLLIGIESHVCIQQTALDLASRDYDVFVCADATSSRGRLDYELSLERMRQENVIVTTVESVLFELCNRCDTPRFKEMLEVIKEIPPADD